METAQSDNTAKGKDASEEAGVQPTTMQVDLKAERVFEAGSLKSAMSALKGNPEADRLRIISLLGLNVPNNDERGATDDEVVWLKENLGLQSNCFQLRGKRWIGRGKQPVVDPVAAASGTAFVKMLPRMSVEDLLNNLKSSARRKAEERARELGRSEEQVQAAGEEAVSDVASLGIADPSLQMLRERHVLCAWAAAEEAGELGLPEDSVLVIPRLLEGVGVTGQGDGDENSIAREDTKPTFLVLEDLVAAGFETRHFTEALPLEDALVVSGALADLHAALWRIRERLGFHLEVAKEVDTVGYEKLLHECLRTLHGYKAGFVKHVEPVVNDIVGAFADTGVEPKLLGHGDAWAHNVMVRRDKESGRVNGVAFVDLGNVRMMSPLEDFFCFLGTMMDGNVLFKSDDRKILRQMYLSRLQIQLGNRLMHFDLDEDLFVERSLFHAYATMLAYFFSPEMWFVTNAKGGIEPALRLKWAFLAAAATAKRIKIAEQQSTDCINEGGESAPREPGIRKRK